MITNFRSTMILTAAFIAVLVASVAWACTPQPEIAILPAADDARPRNVVEVKGTGFSTGPVAIRWGTEETEIIAEAQGPEFSQMVTLPSGAEPGIYYLVATTAGGTGARAPYEVTAEPGAARAGTVSADLWSGVSQARPELAASSTSEVPTAGAAAAGMALLSVGAAAGLGWAAMSIGARRRRSTGIS